MKTDELLEKLLAIMPDAIIEEDGDGMLILNTYLTACDTCADLINSETHDEESGFCQNCSQTFYESEGLSWISN